MFFDPWIAGRGQSDLHHRLGVYPSSDGGQRQAHLRANARRSPALGQCSLEEREGLFVTAETPELHSLVNEGVHVCVEVRGHGIRIDPIGASGTRRPRQSENRTTDEASGKYTLTRE
jgi:hypothetical protein